MENVGAQEGWEYFKEIVLKVQDPTIPMSRKTSQRARRPGWLNRDLWLDLKNKGKFMVSERVGKLLIMITGT